jgi:hypothetical protein
MFRTKVVGKIKTHILCSVTSFSFSFFENFAFMRKRGKNNVERGRPHAHCMPGSQGYKHTLSVCNTYCFSTATVVVRKRLSVTLYVY